MAAAAPSAEVLAELREVFDLYVPPSSPTQEIPTTSLGIAVRSLGHSPTEAELASLCSRAGSSVSFDEFVKVVGSLKDTKLDESDLVAAFRVLDKDGDGMIDAQELKQVLMTRGERLSEEDATALVSLVQPDGEGLIDYAKLSTALMN